MTEIRRLKQLEDENAKLNRPTHQPRLRHGVVLVGGIASFVFAAAFSYVKSRRPDPMKDLLERLKSIIQRTQTTSDPNVYRALSEDLSNIGIEIASIGYERESTSEQIAAIQFAYDAASRAVDTVNR